jgi:hypothetical protein
VPKRVSNNVKQISRWHKKEFGSNFAIVLEKHGKVKTSFWENFADFNLKSLFHYLDFYSLKHVWAQFTLCIEILFENY